MPALRSPSQPVTSAAWFESPLGLSLVQATQRQATPLLTSHIGVRGLYLRPSPAISPLLSGNMLQSMVSLHCGPGGLEGDLRCRGDALPIESESISLVYLLHVLELIDEPAAMLAECARVLQPEGVLFAVGLSTTSLWRLRWMGSRLRPLADARLRGLLEAAGLSVEHAMGLGPAWPTVDDASAANAHDLPSRWLPDALRASLLVLARKRRAGLTPLPARKAQLALGAHAHAG
jgi:SAM-dependent methyltransferase